MSETRLDIEASSNSSSIEEESEVLAPLTGARAKKAFSMPQRERLKPFQNKAKEELRRVSHVTLHSTVNNG